MCVYKGAQLKSKSNTLEPDRRQHDRPSPYVIAQQYSSATLVLLRFHSDKKIWGAPFKSAIPFSYISLKSLKSEIEKPNFHKSETVCFEVVASEFFRNHFISGKHRIIQSLKLRFLQDSSLVHLWTFAGGCKSVRNIPGIRFVKTFSALPLHS
jgi:hypothetical protein